MVQVVRLIVEGKVFRFFQFEEGVIYEGIQKKEMVKIDWDQLVEVIYNWICGNDKVLGVWIEVCEFLQKLIFFNLILNILGLVLEGDVLFILGVYWLGVVIKVGFIFFGNDDKMLLVKNIQLEDGKMILVLNFFKGVVSSVFELMEVELVIVEVVWSVWQWIFFNVLEVEDFIDFFKLGVVFVDVVRLVEEVKELCDGLELENEDVYMVIIFGDFIQLLVRKL